MSSREPARTATLREASTIIPALVLIGTALIGVFVFQMLAPSPPSTASRAIDSPDGVTVRDDDPAVADLDPDLRDALRRATADANDAGVRLDVTSGWRSTAEQERLFREAVDRYGPEEAARRVAEPGTSAHESGDAVDVGPAKGAAWLSEHGAVYGLCQIYANESWHFELRPDAVDRGCPRMYPDATHDPRA